MSLAKKIAHSTVYQTIGKVAAFVLGLVQVYFLTRLLGNVGYGQYSTVIAFFGVLIVFSELGLHITNVTNISDPNTDKSKILSNALTLRLVAIVSVFSISLLLAYFVLPFEQTVRTGMLVSTLAFALLATNQIFVGVFQKFFANHILALGEIISKVVTIAAIIILGKMGYGVIAILASLNVAFASYLALTMITAYRYIPFKLAFDIALWRSLLSQSWPIAFSGILNLIYFKADTLILSLFRGSDDVGIYSLAYKVLEVTIAFPALFGGLLLPILAEAAATSNMVRFRSIIQNGFDALLISAVWVITIVMIFAESIVSVFGPEFKPAAPVLRILSFALSFLFIGNLFGYAVPALKLQRRMIWGYGSAALVGLVAYFVLIPRISYYGGAIGTILTEAIAAFFSAIIVLHTIGMKLSLSRALRTVLSAGISLAIGFYMTENIKIIPWYIGMVLVSIIYFALLYITRAFTKEDIRLLAPQRIRQ